MLQCTRHGLRPTKIFHHIVPVFQKVEVRHLCLCVAVAESIMTPSPGYSSAGCMVAEEGESPELSPCLKGTNQLFGNTSPTLKVLMDTA